MWTVITSDKGGGKCVCPLSFVCLSVCLSVCSLARLLKNTCMDLDKMLRVDRCRDMNELINFLARSAFRNSPDAGTALLSTIYRISAATRNFITSGKSNVYVLAACPSLQRRVLLEWFYSPRAVGTPSSEVHALYRVHFYSSCSSCLLLTTDFVVIIIHHSLCYG